MEDGKWEEYKTNVDFVKKQSNLDFLWNNSSMISPVQITITSSTFKSFQCMLHDYKFPCSQKSHSNSCQSKSVYFKIIFSSQDKSSSKKKK